MNILGISGLDGSKRFKEEHWPGLEEREYRISQGHDASAALIVDGRLVAAAAEERFTRVKHTNKFPAHAVAYCLAEAGLSLKSVDEVAHAFDYSAYESLYSRDPQTRQLYDQVLSREALLCVLKQHFGDYPAARVHHVSHHLAHAASAYLTSGWHECLVVVLDAMGEAHGASVYHASDGGLNALSNMPANDSIGILYSLVTLHLGFDFNSDEYKVMGLAPYGDGQHFRPFFDAAVELRDDGTVGIPILALNRTRFERENLVATRRYIEERLTPRRHPGDEITNDHCDVAAALQECLNKVVLHICGRFKASTGLRRLAMAGGVALNCTANGKLMRSGLFDEVYVQPAAGDDGAALGAALRRASLNGEALNVRSPAPLFGPQYPPIAIERALARHAQFIAVHCFDGLSPTCTEAAKLIVEGRILAWYRGRMEFGPRALGNRSIIADPGRPGMRDRINTVVKKREAFRPFAPAVSLEEVHRWFDVPAGTQLPYMIATFDVRPEHRHALPAVTHEDGSARIQTVSERDNPDFHELLRAVGKLTGREMVLNTSFNIRGQPIVNSPDEAVETFLGTDIDALFLENALVTRR